MARENFIECKLQQCIHVCVFKNWSFYLCLVSLCGHHTIQNQNNIDILVFQIRLISKLFLLSKTESSVVLFLLKMNRLLFVSGKYITVDSWERQILLGCCCWEYKSPRRRYGLNNNTQYKCIYVKVLINVSERERS